MRRASVRALAAILALTAAACENDSTTPSTTSTAYSGTFTGQMIVTTTTSTQTCLSTRTLNGTLKITLRQPSTGTANVTGTAETTGTLTETAVSPAGICAALAGTISLSGTRAVSGTTTNLTFLSSSSSTAPAPGGSVTCTDTIGFGGALAGSAITGTLTYSTACQGTNSVSAITGAGTTAIPVALR